MILSLLFISPVYVAQAAAETSPEKGTIVSLTATSSIELPNDEAVVLYRIEATGSNADVLRKQVNQISQAVHARLKQEKNLKQTTLSRRMEMLWRYDKISSKRVRDGWKLEQREQVTSKKLDAVPDWVDAIEKAGAHLDNLSFQMSDTSLKSAKKSLRLKAIQNFRVKARAMAMALDATSFRIAHLQTGSQPPVYPMRRGVPEMALMKVSEDAAPSLNAGEGKISVTVSGQIVLPEKDFPAK